MNKLLVLSTLMICLAVTADARRNKNGSKKNRTTTTTKAPFAEQVGFSSSSTSSSTTAAPTLKRGKGKGSLRRVISRGPVVATGDAAIGQDAAVEEGAAAQSSLKAGQRNLDALQALLQRKNARQERLDAKAERKSRRRDAARAANAEKLVAQSALDYETYEKAEDFYNLEADASKEIQNQFGLQIISDAKHRENAAISQSSGSQYASGTKLQAQEAVDAETRYEAEELSESEALDNEAVDAEAAHEDLLNAQEAVRVEDEAYIDAQDFQQVGRGFRQADEFFDGERVGSGLNPFGGNNFFDNIDFLG